MLETLDDSNIYKMSLDMPEAKFSGWFNVREEITEEDMVNLMGSVEKSKLNGNWHNVIVLVAYLKDLGFPLEFSDEDEIQITKRLNSLGSPTENFLDFANRMANAGLRPIIHESDKKGIEQRLSDMLLGDRWHNIIVFASEMNNIGLKPHFSPQDSEGLNQYFQDMLESGDMWESVSIAYNANKIGISLEYGSAESLLMKEELEGLRDEGNWLSFANIAVHLAKIGINPGIRSEDIASMKKALDSRRTKLDVGFLEMATAMKYLSEYAIQEPQDLEQLPPIPTERKF